MHHKRSKAKNQRAGCLMCKPNKMNGANKLELGHRGFSKLKKDRAALDDITRDAIHDSYTGNGVESFESVQSMLDEAGLGRLDAE